MLWIKVLHIMLMTSWMVGIFYLPRIFVHWAEGQAASEDVSRLRIMANKLYKFMSIMAILTLISGLGLWHAFGVNGGWLHAKLMFVLGLIGYHFLCRHYLIMLNREGLKNSGKFFRLFNELPLLLFLPILILVVLKPF